MNLSKYAKVSFSPMEIHKIASRQSEKTDKIWFVMTHPSRTPIAVCYADHARFLRMGYRVECCYSDGVEHANAYRSKNQYIFTER